MAMRTILSFFISGLFLFPECLSAQDKIIKLNSKEITGIKVIDLTANTIRYQKSGSPGGRTKAVYRDNIFAITYEDGKEKIIYLPDPAEEGTDYTIEQMRMFVSGTGDARKNYHHIPSYITGYAFGVAGPYFASFTFGPLIALPPAVGIFLASLGSPNMKKQKAEAKFLSSEEYLMGFQHRARNKKIRNAFIGSLLGLGTGLFIFYK